MVAVCILWWLWVIGLIMTKSPLDEATEPYRTGLAMISQNTLIGIVNPVHIRPIVYASIIDCLADKESTNNPEVINWNDCGSPSYGLLQFKEPTFQMYCVDRYRVATSTDDIMNPEVQTECADKMIEDNLIHHWSTDYLCI